MKSKVFFLSYSRLKEDISLLQRLLEAVLPEGIKNGDLTALKIHFGEKGNRSFIDPKYVKGIVKALKATGAIPFLTDTNTLYRGSRTTTPTHIKTAIDNGFDIRKTGAPVVIADGLRGESYREVQIDKEFYDKVKIGAEIFLADAIIALTHFKGHELTGFGGTIKNLGMGCACREGKLSQHSTASPFVDRRGCTGCGVCIEDCAFEAITLINTKASINPERCTGCSHCIVVCPTGAIKIQWNESTANVQKKMAEYALGAIKGKEDMFMCMNFLINITPICDCYGYNKPAITEDIGVLASRDPVAIDHASVELVNRAGRDLFKEIYPDIDWDIQLEYGEKIGLGTKGYELIEI